MFDGAVTVLGSPAWAKEKIETRFSSLSIDPRPKLKLKSPLAPRERSRCEAEDGADVVIVRDISFSLE